MLMNERMARAVCRTIVLTPHGSSSRSVPTSWEPGFRPLSSRKPGAPGACRQRHIRRCRITCNWKGGLSLTGSNADHRIRLAPDEYGVVLSHLYARLARLSGESSDIPQAEALPITEDELQALVDRLWEARGESIVLCDSQDVAVQVLVNGINHHLGNYGKTLDLTRPSRQRQGSDRDVLELLDELRAGKVSALFVAGTDLTHNLPDRDGLAKAIGGIDLVVSLSERRDDFSSLAGFVCPDHHPLEAWSDAEPVDGLVSLSQPLLAPLGNTRSILESLARWSGDDGSAYDMLRGHWEESIFPRVESSDRTSFARFWDRSLHDGFVQVAPRSKAVGEFKADAVEIVSNVPQGDWCLALYCEGWPDRTAGTPTTPGCRNSPTPSPRSPGTTTSASRPARPGDWISRTVMWCASRCRSPRRVWNCRSMYSRVSTTVCWRWHSATASRGPNGLPTSVRSGWRRGRPCEPASAGRERTPPD